jgi:hypothetical protein
MMANQSAFSQFIQAEKVVSSTPSPTTWLDNLFPYLTESVREGNYLPLLVSLIPLPFAAGLFNTAERKFNLPFQLKEGSFKNALMAIKEKGLKAALALEKNPNFKRIWRNGLDFGKSFPFTTQQQIATMFAFLIFSRLTSARSENEFRERSVDSGMGWVLWILGTPLIKEMFAKIINPKLLKASGRFKSREEVIRFLTGDLLKKTEKNYVWFSAVSMAITVALIGIIEPLVAIQWTKRNGTSS